MKAVFLFGLLSLAQWGFAQNAEPSGNWISTCQPASPIRQLEFTSRSGDFLNDDFTGWIEWRDGSRQQLDVPEAWYLQMPAWRHSLCADLALYPIKPGKQALLVLNFDSRPGLDKFHVLLLDLQTKQVLARQLNVGELPQKFRFRYLGNTLWIQMVKAYKGVSDGPDDLILAWREFRVKDGQILMNWR